MLVTVRFLVIIGAITLGAIFLSNYNLAGARKFDIPKIHTQVPLFYVD